MKSLPGKPAIKVAVATRSGYEIFMREDARAFLVFLVNNARNSDGKKSRSGNEFVPRKYWSGVAAEMIRLAGLESLFADSKNLGTYLKKNAAVIDSSLKDASYAWALAPFAHAETAEQRFVQELKSLRLRAEELLTREGGGDTLPLSPSLSPPSPAGRFALSTLTSQGGCENSTAEALLAVGKQAVTALVGMARVMTLALLHRQEQDAVVNLASSKKSASLRRAGGVLSNLAEADGSEAIARDEDYGKRNRAKESKPKTKEALRQVTPSNPMLPGAVAAVERRAGRNSNVDEDFPSKSAVLASNDGGDDYVAPQRSEDESSDSDAPRTSLKESTEVDSDVEIMGEKQKKTKKTKSKVTKTQSGKSAKSVKTAVLKKGTKKAAKGGASAPTGKVRSWILPDLSQTASSSTAHLHGVCKICSQRDLLAIFEEGKHICLVSTASDAELRDGRSDDESKSESSSSESEPASKRACLSHALSRPIREKAPSQKVIETAAET